MAVVTDLFFQSRIGVAARLLGRQVRYLAPDQASSTPSFALAIVDLEARGDPLHAIRSLRVAGSGPIVAFGPHVDTERRKLARAAGAHRVLAKSKFVTDLPHILQPDSASAIGTPMSDTDAADALAE